MPRYGLVLMLVTFFLCSKQFTLSAHYEDESRGEGQKDSTLEVDLEGTSSHTSYGETGTVQSQGFVKPRRTVSIDTPLGRIIGADRA